jgi:acyl-CoA synthetase (AMP-forming)/AMP-acid ligase II
VSFETVFEALERWRVCAPRAPALIQDGGRSLTFGALAEELDAITSGLHRAGLRPGEAVVFSVRPSIEAIVLILAIVRSGAIVVAADPGMSPELFEARMASLTPRWVMAESLLYALGRSRAMRSWLERRSVRLPNFNVHGATTVLTGRWPRPKHTINYSALASERELWNPPAGHPEALAFVVFTSGTTAAPRGVVHSARSVGASLQMLSEQLGLTREDRVYSGQLHLIIPALIAGAVSFIPRPRFSARRTLRDLGRLHASHVYWAPAHADLVMRTASRRNSQLPNSLRTVLIGSAPVTAGFLRRLREVLPAHTRAYGTYALTEMLPVSFIEMDEKLAYDGVGDLVGAPCHGVRVRFGPDGEVFLSGPNLCAGYLDQPHIAEIPTGDLGCLRDGRLILLGRKKEMIIRGDHNIYPGLVESVVAAVPGVRCSAMVGVYRDQVADEVVVLAVEAQSGVDNAELERRVRRELWFGPRRIDVDARPDYIVMTEVPLSGRSQKIDRQALREAVVALIPCA